MVVLAIVLRSGDGKRGPQSFKERVVGKRKTECSE